MSAVMRGAGTSSHAFCYALSMKRVYAPAACCDIQIERGKLFAPLLRWRYYEAGSG